MWSSTPRPGAEERSSSRSRMHPHLPTPSSTSNMERRGKVSYARTRTPGKGGGKDSNTRPLPSPSSRYYTTDDDEFDDSSCDDTYVSMTSSRGQVNAPAPCDSSCDTSIENRGILKETTRASPNKTSSRNRARSRPLPTLKKKFEYHGHASKTATAGVLDKLKEDINSLALIRSQTSEFESPSMGMGRAPRSGMRNSYSPKPTSRAYSDSLRSHSVDPRSRISDRGVGDRRTAFTTSRRSSSNVEDDVEKKDLLKKVELLQRENEWLQEKARADHEQSLKAKTEEVNIERASFQVLQQENKRLQEQILAVKDDSMKIIEHNEQDFRAQKQNLQTLVETSKAKEDELETALREVIGNIEREQGKHADELAIAYKLHHSEMTLMEQKLRGTTVEVAEKVETIRTLEGKVEALQKSLDEGMGQAEDVITEKRETVANLEKQLYLQKEELNVAKASYQEMESETKGMIDKLSDAERRNRELQEAVDKSQRVAEKLSHSLEENSILETQVANFKRAIEKQDEENTSLKKIVSGTEDEKRKAEEDLASVKIMKANVEIELNSLRARLDGQTRELESERQKTAELTAKNDDLESASKIATGATEEVINEMKSKLIAAEKEIKSLKGKSQGKDKQLVDMNEATEIMHAKLKEMKAECDKNSKTNEINKELKSKLDAAETRIKSLNDKLQEKEKALTGMNKSTEEMHKKMNELKSTVIDSQTKAGMMKQEVSSLQAELMSVTERLHMAKDDNTKLTETAKEKEVELATSIKSTKAELARTKADLSKSDAKLKKLQTESVGRNGQLKSALQSLDEMMKYIETSREEHDEAVASLERDLNAAIEKKHDAEKETKKTASALQQAKKLHKEAADRMEEERKNLKKELENVRIGAIKQIEIVNDNCAKKLKDRQDSEASTWKAKQDLEVSFQECSSRVELLAKELQISKEQSVADEKVRLNLDKTLAETRSLVASLETEVEELQQQSRTDRQAKEETDAHVEQLKKTLKEKSSKLNASYKMVESLEAQIAALQNSCNDEAGRWAKELEECKEELTQVKDKLAFSVQKHSELAKEKGVIGEKLNCAERDSAALKESLEELQKAKSDGNSDVQALTKALRKKTKAEKEIRGELAQKKQMISILQSNEKHLEEHVSSLEEQINRLVSEYESRLREEETPKK